MNGEPQRDGQLVNNQFVPATNKDNHRNGRPLLTLVPDYIPAEVSLENLGYFTPSSKRIKSIYVKEKVLGNKIGPDGTTHTIKAEREQYLFLAGNEVRKRGAASKRRWRGGDSLLSSGLEPNSDPGESHHGSSGTLSADSPAARRRAVASSRLSGDRRDGKQADSGERGEKL
jgi:hypothetical protein